MIRRTRKIDLEGDEKVAVNRRGRKSNVQKLAELALLDENEATKNWEYAVLVCDTPTSSSTWGSSTGTVLTAEFGKPAVLMKSKTSGAEPGREQS